MSQKQTMTTKDNIQKKDCEMSDDEAVKKGVVHFCRKNGQKIVFLLLPAFFRTFREYISSYKINLKYWTLPFAWLHILARPSDPGETRG